MSRTTLSVLTAIALIAASAVLTGVRYRVLGAEVYAPKGPGAWKVQMLVTGKLAGADARLLTATPFDFEGQHIWSELFRSSTFLNKPPYLRHPKRRQVLWLQRAGVPEGPFRASYEFYCKVNVRHPSASMTQLGATLYAPPEAGQYIDVIARYGAENEEISNLARRLTQGLDDPADQVEALFRHVDQAVGNEPNLGGPSITALDCLRNERGDSPGKSRLLVALLRNRGFPARHVTGLTLAKGPEQLSHVWVEAWIQNRWLPMCPFYHHYGKVPSTYLTFGFGDLAMVRGHNIRDLDYAFLVERVAPDGVGQAANASSVRRLLTALSLRSLPPAEQRLVEFLLLLPIAALMVCIYRNLIGLYSFGTFAPALVGLAFRDWHSLPGMLVFVGIVLVGWLMRRVLNNYHLLQVPRTAFLLSLVVIVLIGAILAANYQNPPVAATQYVSLFPMVILTGMIERFWTLETEDSTVASFKTLLGTMFIAASIGLFLSLRAVVDHMVQHPETLGIIMAGQLLIGRYTGYKLSELYRFRDFVQQPEA